MKTLSNGKLLSRYSTVPYCLDNEYVPASHQLDWYQSSLTESAKHQLREARNKLVKRELIRTLIYSPQVIVGRQSLVNEEVMVQFARKEQDHLLELMEQGRIAVLLGRSNGRKGQAHEEQDMLDFLDHEPFPFTHEFKGEAAWRDIISAHGAGKLPYLRLSSEESSEVPARFTRLFLGVDVDESAMDTLFRNCLGRSTTPEECGDFRRFWGEDVADFAGSEKANRGTISRTSVYQEYVWSPLKPDTEYLKSRDAANPGVSTSLMERRRRYQLVVKRIADLAYNANLPFTIDVKSFVPPDLPDPTALPGSIYQHVQDGSEETVRQQEAVRQAWRHWADVAADTSQFFFHKMQRKCLLPNFGSLSLRDAVEVSAYPEWKAFAAAQRAVTTFKRADELEQLVKDYWQTISDLHNRLGEEMGHRGWRGVGTGTVAMGLSVSAHILGHALLPHGVTEVWPWWATVATSTMVAKPIHAGLDFALHKPVKSLHAGLDFVLHFTHMDGKLIHEGGFKQGSMDEFALTDDEIGRLERLRASDVRISEAEQAEQETVTRAAATIASEE